METKNKKCYEFAKDLYLMNRRQLKLNQRLKVKQFLFELQKYDYVVNNAEYNKYIDGENDIIMARFNMLFKKMCISYDEKCKSMIDKEIFRIDWIIEKFCHTYNYAKLYSQDELSELLSGCGNTDYIFKYFESISFKKDPAEEDSIDLESDWQIKNESDLPSNVIPFRKRN